MCFTILNLGVGFLLFFGDAGVFIGEGAIFLSINITGKNLITFLLSVALCSTYSIASTIVPYICIFGILFISMVRYGVVKNIRSYEMIPIAIVFCWVYGLIIGLLNNPIDGVIANFAGMSCYLVFYALKSARIEEFKILEIIKFSAIVNIIYAFVSIGDSLLLGNFITNGVVDASDLNATIGQFRLYWSVGIILAVGYFGLFFSRYIAKSPLSIFDYFWALMAIGSIFSTFSKGFILQLFFTIFFIALGVGFRGGERHDKSLFYFFRDVFYCFNILVRLKLRCCIWKHIGVGIG